MFGWYPPMGVPKGIWPKNIERPDARLEWRILWSNGTVTVCANERNACELHEHPISGGGVLQYRSVGEWQTKLDG